MLNKAKIIRENAKNELNYSSICDLIGNSLRDFWSLFKNIFAILKL